MRVLLDECLPRKLKYSLLVYASAINATSATIAAPDAPRLGDGNWNARRLITP